MEYRLVEADLLSMCILRLRDVLQEKRGTVCRGPGRIALGMTWICPSPDGAVLAGTFAVCTLTVPQRSAIRLR